MAIRPPQALLDTFWRPTALFAALKSARGWSWWPFALLMLSFALLQWLYFSRVDWGWYQQTVLSPMLVDLAPQDRAKVLAEMTWGTALAAQLGLGVAMMLLTHALMAFYLSRVTLSDEENLQGFGDWFGLTWWCSLVLVLPMLLAAVVALIQSGQLSPALLAPAALNRLLDLAPTHAWYNLAEGVSLLLPWQVFLYYCGIRAWTALSQAQAWVIALLPYLVIYGIWLAIRLI
ncbi:YIP1 family protein [Ferrimonas balearica]|uniref:YIP1 family protein n=1 Tax=Ferrimonas balearica TaxID=44012 RepID=UPI001C99A69E|nr:YIP1 family protein [Ferrimonas balearica]MBY5992015.1 YIP1 family protein [Ferrimonas balearica]